ncbi:GNAT family N-acetyltransferase [Sinomicrobium weinanense]|uniref:GNAT family N-acetyltransferase n=1 Tax=Sinomicrobium weinanense TaxID=2842200 RepID=UPI0031EAF7B5
MKSDITKLDNPVWYSLNETHREFSMPYESVKFYQPEVCPFGGFKNIHSANDIEEYAKLEDNFFVVGEKPHLGPSLKLQKELVCDQMILEQEVEIEPGNEIIELKKEHQQDLSDLVNLVMPGYFKKNTTLLGNYYGIFADHKLIAVTGERMKMDAYTEVSAVVTHPEHAGKGYAKQLVSHTCKQILDKGKHPYLHVAETNTGAIKLYEKLGFVFRRKMSFWNLINQ